jgi:hypothetical protein
VYESRPEQSSYGPVQCSIFLDWDRTIAKILQTGLGLVWTGSHCLIQLRNQFEMYVAYRHGVSVWALYDVRVYELCMMKRCMRSKDVFQDTK